MRFGGVRATGWTRRLVVFGWAASIALAVGCGPSLYTARILPASQAVEQAQAADAPEHAPYEYHYAAQHLRKAREEAAEANYQDAIEYAESAEEYAVKARELARRRLREMGR